MSKEKQLQRVKKAFMRKFGGHSLPNLIGMSDLSELLTSLFPLDFHKVHDTEMFSHDPNVGISHSQLNPLGSFVDNKKSCQCSESSSGEYNLSLCSQSLQQLEKELQNL